jgi:hypothetical protein
MKIASIEIKNIGLHADTKIAIDKPLLAFYGDVQQGKTTILRCVPWCLGGEFPADIIRRGAEEAMIRITLAEPPGSITRSFYRGKNGVTARAVDYIENSQRVSAPAGGLKKFLNPFIGNQDCLRNMTDVKRREFFKELFPLDTKALDTEAAQCSAKAGDLRSKLKGYGDIDLTRVEPVNVDAIRDQLSALRQAHVAARTEWEEKIDAIRRDHVAKVEAIRADVKKANDERQRRYGREVASTTQKNQAISAHNTERLRQNECLVAKKERIAKLEAELVTLRSERDQIETWMKTNPAKDPLPMPDVPETVAMPELPKMPDFPPEPPQPNTTALEAAIQNSAAQNVRAEQYKANQKRAEARETDRKELARLEAREKAIKVEKTALLKGASEKCGIKDFAIDETGAFTFEGTTSGMLSESQMMRLSQAISGLYPEGFNLSLVDRGESLGRKGIAELVQHAKEDERNVLVTVVGDAPAETPPDVGVFVVSAGQVTAKGE